MRGVVQGFSILRTRTVAVAAVLAAVAAVGLFAPSAALADHLPYHDPSLPVATRVNDLLGRMSLDEKLGQMTQAERAAVTNAQITQFRLGSLLSGGGSAPSPNNATSWANMYDNFQNAALATPLGIPLIYGVDAVHGHNNVVGATIFPHNIGLGATRDPALVQQIGRATGRGGLRHRHRLGLRALPVRRPQRPMGPHLRVVRRDAGAAYVDGHDDHRPAGLVARARPGPCWPPPSTTSATAARPAAADQGNTQLTEARAAGRSTCHHSRPRCSATSAR